MTTSDTILPTVVIGAGIVGVATALSLAQRGRSVTVIERLPGPAELCSRANAGILAVGHAKAWAGLRPSTPAGPPYLGRVRQIENLWINAGHGQLG